MGNLKYEIRLFTIRFSKNLAQLRRKEQSVLEIKLEIMKLNLNSNKMLEKYNKCKNKLEEICCNIAEGVIPIQDGGRWQKASPVFPLQLLQTLELAPKIF